MDVNFSTDSWWIITLILMLFTTIPVKIGATLFNAPNKKLIHCALAVALGTISAVLCMQFIGGFTGLFATFIAISIIYWYILQISFASSFAFTIVVLIIQFALIHGLGQFGLMMAAQPT